MSLVAYDTSSDDESEYEDNKSPQGAIAANTVVSKSDQLPPSDKVYNGDITDEDIYITQIDDKEKSSINSLSKLLPKPKKFVNITDTLNNFSKPTFAVLPTPKSVDTHSGIEEDDEFLHKKPNKKIIENSKKSIKTKNLPVKITIQSLKNFEDVDNEIANKARNRNTVNLSRASASSGLLSILPKAKSEQNFTKVSSSCTENNERSDGFNNAKPMLTSFVPDSVKYRRPATSTEDVERLKPTKRKFPDQTSKRIVIPSNTKHDSEESDDDNTGSDDFFSFNADHSLPEVSDAEINALVAKRAAKIVETGVNFIMKSNESQKSRDIQEKPINENDLLSTRNPYHQEQQLDSEALQALVGGNTKRRRQKQSDIQVIDIDSSQVMPNKDEWMRTALASSTTYQPTGVLVDDEPASGTRRKHQITYLAHKAKANEAELQAMWSANRQNRRATQNKYGF